MLWRTLHIFSRTNGFLHSAMNFTLQIIIQIFDTLFEHGNCISVGFFFFVAIFPRRELGGLL